MFFDKITAARNWIVVQVEILKEKMNIDFCFVIYRYVKFKYKNKTNHPIRYRETDTLRRLQIKQYTPSIQGGKKINRNII